MTFVRFGHKSIIIFVVILFVSSCGYFYSGNWKDDPDNWKRAFDSKKPDDVIVHHSQYWRSPHWSYEFEYYFEIQSNEELRQQLFSRNQLMKLDSQGVVSEKKKCFSDCPDWFAPKAADKYDVWILEDQPDRNFRVFIDKDTGNLFITDNQK